MNAMRSLRMPLALLFIALLALPLAIAEADDGSTTEKIGDIILYRRAPARAKVGQKFWVLLQIENTGDSERHITFMERLGEAVFDQSQAEAIEVWDPGPEGLPPSGEKQMLKLFYYEWKIQLPPGKSATLTYWLIPTRPGTYVISPAMLTLEGESFRTQSFDIEILCEEDAYCDAEAGETYLNCPADCMTGSSDGICDGAEDGRIDPDCAEGYDPDAGEVPSTEATPGQVMKTSQPPISLPAALSILAGLVVLATVLFLLAFRRIRRL